MSDFVPQFAKFHLVRWYVFRLLGGGMETGIMKKDVICNSPVGICKTSGKSALSQKPCCITVSSKGWRLPICYAWAPVMIAINREYQAL